MKLVVCLAICIGSLASCRGYQPGSFAYFGKPFPGARATLECIDVAVAANRDDVAGGAIARFSLANRCDQAAAVDFTRLVARQRQGDGQWQVVAPTDPRSELRPAMLEARSIATEYLEYQIDKDKGSALCFELAGLVGVSPRAGETDLCLDVRTAEVLR